MDYLTLEEFQNQSSTDLLREDFDKYLVRSSDLLDYLTSYYYVTNDMSQVNPWVNEQFKKALIAQIEYFHEVGNISFESINNGPQAFSVGRTSITQSNKSNNEQSLKSLVAEEVYFYLSQTGLLFGGVNVL